MRAQPIKGQTSWIIHRSGDRRSTYTKAVDSEEKVIALIRELRASSPGLSLEVTEYNKQGKPEQTYVPEYC